jgi:hypothetical protein
MTTRAAKRAELPLIWAAYTYDDERLLVGDIPAHAAPEPLGPTAQLRAAPRDRQQHRKCAALPGRQQIGPRGPCDNRSSFFVERVEKPTDNQNWQCLATVTYASVHAPAGDES